MCQYSSDNGKATDWHLVHLGSAREPKQESVLCTKPFSHLLGALLLADLVPLPQKLRPSFPRAVPRLKMLEFGPTSISPLSGVSSTLRTLMEQKLASSLHMLEERPAHIPRGSPWTLAV